MFNNTPLSKMGSSIELILDDSMILNSIGHTNVTKDNLEYIISCATMVSFGISGYKITLLQMV